jgi:hypothetical protein
MQRSQPLYGFRFFNGGEVLPEQILYDGDFCRFSGGENRGNGLTSGQL